MLKSLYLKNFVLIDETNLDFQIGLSVFTGETGAGKSILIDAIGLLCGERLTTDYIRKSADKMIVEGAFEITSQHGRKILEANGFGDEDVTVLSRELTLDGKSVNRCNGRIIPVSFLKELGSVVIDIHSQHDTQYLLNVKTHRTLLDQFGFHQASLSATAETYNNYDRLQSEFDDLSLSSLNPEDLGFLRYQIDEIQNADLKIGEDDDLENRQRAMMAVEKISMRLNAAVDLLDGEGRILEKYHEVQKQIEGIKEMEDIQSIAKEFDEIYFALNDKSEALKEAFNRLYFDENELNLIQERLFFIAKLKRKYGRRIIDILQRKEEFEAKVQRIENRAEVLDRLQAQIDKAYDEFMRQASLLHEARTTDAARLESEIKKQLVSLSLPHAEFKIVISSANPSTHGIDNVEFLISMNKGEDMKPLIKVASGGELSRLMLGLKVIFSGLQGIETVIFDEIDAGVSGRVASAIGIKMHELAHDAQVFAVTHLGQVAACADTHYLVVKKSDAERTHTYIHQLDDAGRIDALASIANGTLSETALTAAKELLEHHRSKLVKP
ncbi:MAG: DNA repair protein RecN [Erysipelotrichales bacterium]|nr:MAG: DNA repair protein RecN [Erysipelotrichales bacterium]